MNRDIRALKDVDSVDQIHSDSWSINEGEYVVDRVNERKWDCGCDDHKYRKVACKHIRRVQMRIGVREKPMLTLDDF